MNTNKIFALVFNFFRRWKVKKNRVTLIEKLDTGGKGSLFEIRAECERRNLPLEFHVITHADYVVSLRNIPGLLRLFTRKAYFMATSGYIFLNDNFIPMAYMDVAPETTVVQVWHGMGSFKKFGGSTELDEELIALLKEVNENVTHVLASAEGIRGNYAEAFCVPEEKVLSIGCPQADYYFRKHDIASTRKKLEEQFPKLRGKKLALYAPTFRDDSQRDKELLSHFDFEAFERKCGDEYCLAVRLHPQVQSSRVPDLVPDLTGYPDVRELLLMTDLLIADYSSIAVEYALLERPILLYAFDKDWYLTRDRDFYFDYETTAPGPILQTMEDLTDCVCRQGWDIDKVRAFARLHNDYFDAFSAKRVADFYFGVEKKRDSERIAREMKRYGQRDVDRQGKRGQRDVDGQRKRGQRDVDGQGKRGQRDVDGQRKLVQRDTDKWEKNAKEKSRKIKEKNKKIKIEGKQKERERMKIIAGLGNPTDQYKGTRHNVGFMAIDRLSSDLGIPVNQHKHKAMVGSGFIAGQRVLLMKPLTYMNLSGESIRAAVDFYKVEPEDILIIYDDISLEPGMLRIRKKGSAGGHNGMKNIISHLGYDTFPRIRVGIGGEKHPGMDLKDYVLGHFSGDEMVKVEEALDKAVEAAKLIAQDETDEAMNRYSMGKKKRAKTEEEV